MPSEVLSEAVRTLLREHLTSFEELELLLFLHAHAGEPFTLPALCQRTGIPHELAARAVAALERHQLIRSSTAAPFTFRFAPPAAHLNNMTDDLARLYREQRAAIMAEMSVNAINRIRSGSLRAFADAFVITPPKGKSNG